MPFRIDFFVVTIDQGALLPFTGVYVREFFLKTIKHFNSELFTLLHSSLKPKPYAVRPLRSIENEMRTVGGYWVVSEGDRLTFSISILWDDVEEELLDIFERVDVVRFGAIDCEIYRKEVIEFRFDEPFSALSNHIYLIFHTPTFFNIHGRKLPFLYPDPIRVLSNLSTIWNAFTSKNREININKLLDWAKENVMIKNYELMTRELQIEEIKLTGFEGRIKWIILNEKMLDIVDKLLRFAELSNVGEKRTYGLGVTSYHSLNDEKL